MWFPSSLRLSAARTPLLFALLASATLPGLAQVTGQPPPDATTGPVQTQSSSSTDVQTAQVVAKPKDLYTRDVALSAFAQYTNRTNGNFLREDTTSSGGGMVSYRQSPRWWAGYEINYGYTKYTDAFGKVYRVKHNANEITAAYLLKSPVYRGVRAFLSIGGGAIIFSPTEYGGSILLTPGKPATQALPMFVYSLGVEHNITEHLGIRFQYRSDTYKAPNFKQPSLDLHSLRSSTEPAVGIYYRF